MERWIAGGFLYIVAFVLGRFLWTVLVRRKVPLASATDPHPSRACRVVESLIGLGLTIWSLAFWRWLVDPAWWHTHPHLEDWVSILIPAGAILQLLSALLLTAGNLSMGESWCMGIKDEPQPLVTGGVYAHVRHPINAAMIGYLSAAAMIMPTFWMIAAMAVTSTALLVESALEEDYWLRQRPAEYAQLIRRTGGFLPWKSALRWLAGR